MNADAQKNQQAAQAIASQIGKLPANAPMDHGTAGGLMGMTKREGEAENMARYFVTRMYKVQFAGDLYENWTAEQRQANEIVKAIAAAAIAVTGK
jgi:hypothetical protein